MVTVKEVKAIKCKDKDKKVVPCKVTEMPAPSLTVQRPTVTPKLATPSA